MTESAIHQNFKCFHGLWDDNSYTCDNQLWVNAKHKVQQLLNLLKQLIDKCWTEIKTLFL